MAHDFLWGADLVILVVLLPKDDSFPLFRTRYGDTNERIVHHRVVRYAILVLVQKPGLQTILDGPRIFYQVLLFPVVDRVRLAA